MQIILDFFIGITVTPQTPKHFILGKSDVVEGVDDDQFKAGLIFYKFA
jgi:hypothetical protein